MVFKLFACTDDSVTSKPNQNNNNNHNTQNPHKSSPVMVPALHRQILGPPAALHPPLCQIPSVSPSHPLNPTLWLLQMPSDGQGQPLTDTRLSPELQSPEVRGPRMNTPQRQPSLNNDESCSVSIRASLPPRRNYSEKRAPFPSGSPMELNSHCPHWSCLNTSLFTSRLPSLYDFSQHFQYIFQFQKKHWKLSFFRVLSRYKLTFPIKALASDLRNIALG